MVWMEPWACKSLWASVFLARSRPLLPLSPSRKPRVHVFLSYKEAPAHNSVQVLVLGFVSLAWQSHSICLGQAPCTP